MNWSKPPSDTTTYTGRVLQPVQAWHDLRCSRTPQGTAGSVACTSARMGQREQAQQLCWLTGFHLLHQVGTFSSQMGRMQGHKIVELKFISRLGDCSSGPQ